MSFDTVNWPMLNIRCVVPCCECKCFKPGSPFVRQCDSCDHGWVAHVLAKLNPLPLFPSSLMEGITGAVAYDVVSMILFGTHAIPVKLKILLDRLIPAHLQNDLNRVLHVFGWSFQDYSRGYVLLDNLGQARERWTTCGREEEPVILQQFLRFFETRALAYDMLVGQSPRGVLPHDFPQTTPPLSSAETSPLLGGVTRPGGGLSAPLLPSVNGGGGGKSLATSQHIQVGDQTGPVGPLPVANQPSLFPLNHLLPLMSGSAALASFLSSTVSAFPCTASQPGVATAGKMLQGDAIKLDASDIIKKQRFKDSYSTLLDDNNLKQRSEVSVNKRSRNNDHTRCPKQAKRAGIGRMLRVSSETTISPPNHGNDNISKLGQDEDHIDEEEKGDSDLHNLTRSRSGSPDSSISDGTQQIDMGSDLIGQCITGVGRSKKRVLCTTCNKTFCDKGALKIHYSAVHLQEMHKCTMKGCNMWFSSRRSRNRHSANPNPRLHMSQSNKKLPENAVIVDDGTGRALGERMPIPNSVLNPPVVPINGGIEEDRLPPHSSGGPRASSSPFLLSPSGDPGCTGGGLPGFTRIHAPVFQIPHHLKPTPQHPQHQHQHELSTSMSGGGGSMQQCQRNRSCSGGSSSQPSSSGLTNESDSAEPMNLVLSRSAGDVDDDGCADDEECEGCLRQPPKLYQEALSPGGNVGLEINCKQSSASGNDSEMEENNNFKDGGGQMKEIHENVGSPSEYISESNDTINSLKNSLFVDTMVSSRSKLFHTTDSNSNTPAVVH